MSWYEDEYLKSDYWRQRKEDALDRAGRKCTVCSDRSRLQVHHNTYERCPYHEFVTDLTVLCDDCHSLFHGKLPKPRTQALSSMRKAPRHKISASEIPIPSRVAANGFLDRSSPIRTILAAPATMAAADAATQLSEAEYNLQFELFREQFEFEFEPAETWA